MNVAMETTTLKTCRDCGEDKDEASGFHKSFVTKSGDQRYAAYCKPCARDRSRTWHRNNEDRAREGNRQRAAKRRQVLGPEESRRYERNLKIKRKYGIDIAAWDQLFADQAGLCLICRTDLSTTKACVDHCHRTGVVRGLLCDVCNQGIGYFKDDPQRLRAAADYVEKAAVS